MDWSDDLFVSRPMSTLKSFKEPALVFQLYNLF